MQKILSKLEPAHVRVLNLLLVQPPPAGLIHGNATINYGFLMEHTFWEQTTLQNLLAEARLFLGVKSTDALIEVWRARHNR